MPDNIEPPKEGIKEPKGADLEELIKKEEKRYDVVIREYQNHLDSVKAIDSKSGLLFSFSCAFMVIFLSLKIEFIQNFIYLKIIQVVLLALLIAAFICLVFYVFKALISRKIITFDVDNLRNTDKNRLNYYRYLNKINVSYSNYLKTNKETHKIKHRCYKIAFVLSIICLMLIIMQYIILLIASFF